MNKNILKKFAIESKKDLMDKVSNKMDTLYLNQNFDKFQNGEIITLSFGDNRISLTGEEYKNRKKLQNRINEIGKDSVIEEVAYTWFNRIIAIRYMEIHDFLPLTKDNQSLGIRVLSSKDNTADPEIMKFTNLTNPELDINFNAKKYSEIKDNNKKFEYILLLICNKLGKVIPDVFDGVTDYINLLIPDNLLNENGFVNRLLKEVPEEDFKDVEVIGWLYQYYNQTEKDKVISAKKAYKKNEIPYATQLFTPDWIVKYMVENSLGRYYIEHNGKDNNLEDNWKYFIKDNLDINNNKISPEDITFIDPCCGSGHILVYAFEIFYQLYEREGYNKNDIPELILKNNLYGLDIDDRAGQLSVLSVLLKAREYDKNIFNKDITKHLNIMSIQESNKIDRSLLEYIDNSDEREQAKYLTETFNDAKEIGSLLIVEEKDYTNLINTLINSNSMFLIELRNRLLPIIKVANMLSKKYDIVVTNPPYMSSQYMNPNLKKYISTKYKDSKRDLCTAFMEIKLLSNNGMLGMINMHSWMFLGSYEKLRKKLLNNYLLICMIHLGSHAFESISGEVVQTTSFIFKKSVYDCKSIVIDLTKYNFSEEKKENFYNKQNYYYIKQSIFEKIPNNIFSYSISPNTMNILTNCPKLENFGKACQGLATTDNDKFLRLWFELNFSNINFDVKDKNETIGNGYKWYPYNKAGFYRKWSSINEYVVNYENDGFDIKKSVMTKYPYLNSPNFVVKNTDTYFKSGITWNDVATGGFCARLVPNGFIYDAASPMFFCKNHFIFLSYFNSILFQKFADIICQGLHYSTGHIPKIPFIKLKDEVSINSIENKVKENLNLSEFEWNSYETSWSFKKHPFLNYNNTNTKLFDCCQKYMENNINNFKKMKKNEEDLNYIWIKNANLSNEISINVPNEKVSYRLPCEKENIKSFISYAVGCMFGRYSIDEDGLIYAGGVFDKSKYKAFEVDNDNIIPITDEPYFGDDIVERFKKFIKVVFGENTFNENMNYIAETLGKRGTETSEDTIRRYFVNDFFNDHCKIYQKRPIYWLFDSGKKNGFKCLIYMHRYDENLVPKMRVDYLHRVQNTYEKLLSDINYRLTDDLSVNDKKELQRRQIDLNSKLQETKEYDEKVSHIANMKINIDLDDGVKVNYAKFQDILAKIK